MLDDLERALEAAEEHEEAKLEDGVRLVHRSLADALAQGGARGDRDRRARSTRTSTRRCSRSRPTRRSPARSSRCCRRATGSATACSGRRAWSSLVEHEHDPLRDARRREERVAGRDQEGVPQARAPVPPGPQPGRRGRGGEVQGGADRLRRALRPGEAQAVRLVRQRARARRRARAGRRAVRLQPADFDLGDLLGGVFNRGRRGGVGAPRSRSAAPTSRRT